MSMLSEKQIERINKLLSDRTFKFTGEIIPGYTSKVDIDYKFKITGHKKMISVGEYYDYLKLKVTIIGLNDDLSKIIFGVNNDSDVDFAKVFESQLYRFYSNLNLEMTNFLDIFDSDVRTTIDDLQFDLPKPITESKMSRMSRNAVRTTVKDILNVIKNKNAGEFYLPGENGEEYSFSNLPFSYSVNLFIEIDDNIDGYVLNGYYLSEDNVIEILIKFNPKTLRKNAYNIIGELNDIVAHELEHGFQYITEGKVYQEPPTDSLSYYTQIDEVKAQRVGFRRVAKLRKLPFNDVVKEWFENHKDIHELSEDECEKVINVIIDGK